MVKTLTHYYYTMVAQLAFVVDVDWMGLVLKKPDDMQELSVD